MKIANGKLTVTGTFSQLFNICTVCCFWKMTLDFGFLFYDIQKP
jgi:hypothetical protein